MHYSIKEILSNDNLIFDLKYDISYKRVFLNNNNLKYFSLIINKLEGKINTSNSILLNTEIPNSKSKSSNTDLIIKNNNHEYIIEMNKRYSKLLFYKNIHYLLKEHSRRNYRKNFYGLKNYTILVNIDNYDCFNKNKLIYKVALIDKKYNKYMYKNITIIHINLDYLKNKYYNNVKLTELEKLLIIFIEQRKDKILNITNNECVKELIDYMDTLKLEEEYIATYDREEFEQGLKEEFEQEKKGLARAKQGFAKEKQGFAKEKQGFAKEKQDFVKEKQDFVKERQNLEKEIININKAKQEIYVKQKDIENERIHIAKELKILGIPINKIVELTNMSIKDIMML